MARIPPVVSSLYAQAGDPFEVSFFCPNVAKTFRDAEIRAQIFNCRYGDAGRLDIREAMDVTPERRRDPGIFCGIRDAVEFRDLSQADGV